MDHGVSLQYLADRTPFWEVSMPLAGAPGYAQVGRFVVRNGRLVLIAAGVFPEKCDDTLEMPEKGGDLPKGSLTSRVHRLLSIEALEAKVRERGPRLQGLQTNDTVYDDLIARAVADVASVDVSRPGRRGHGERHYAQVAARYVEAVEQGLNPNVVIAEAYDVPESTARGWVYQARARKLLTAAVGNRAEGQLTAKARRLLERPSDERGAEG